MTRWYVIFSQGTTYKGHTGYRYVNARTRRETMRKVFLALTKKGIRVGALRAYTAPGGGPR